MQSGIRTFRDDDAMDRGKLLEPELKKAIRESAISVIVFSRDYASSKWCLDEVLTIIQEKERVSSKHEVVPVFYNVEPSDVRNQTGSFEEAFSGYDDMIEAETDPQKKVEWLEKVKAWRVSLRKAGSLTGMVLTAKGHEAKFIGKIVNVIKKKLNYKLLYVEDKLVGIENNVAEIESWLQDPSPNAVILCIHGMGGIGKTTISKCIYNSNSHEYDGSCFLADIQETSNQHNGLLRLQSQLLSTLLRSNKEEVIWNIDEGIVKVTNAFCNKKVLLVLDDISTRQQLTALLGPQQFHYGSKVIITTRHKWLLTSFDVNPKVHPVKELDPYDAYKLFSLYAFHRDHPIERYIVQSNLVVRHCGGHPLALKVLGSSLNGKTIDVWEDAIRKLEVVPNPEIQKLLKLSYDTLEDTNDKDLFLHIACFFVGENKEFIVKLLAECELYPILGIQNLMDRCLLYIENGRVMMHNLIKQMGREVVHKESPKDPGKRSRLWNHQDSFNVLKENGVVGQLKILNLSYSMELIKTPDFDGLPRLESLLLEGCLSLIQVCESIVNLEKLVLLDISGCRSLKNIPCLPRSLVSLNMHGCSNLGGLGQVQCMDSCSLSSLLVDLDVSQCNLYDKSFPEDWSNLFSLKCLDISYHHITSLPGCVKRLPSLKVLRAKKCSHLQKVLDVPKSVTELSVSENMSLEIVQPTPNPLAFLFADECQKLCAVEGCFKLESIQNVDRKIIRYLGLESNSENGFDKQNTYTEEDSVKVLYEFGIFSTYVLGKTLPCFKHKEIGSDISFRVPSHPPNGSRISGLNIMV
ncbi:putative TIR domain, P-loop containing nucleoside triphosphate hydrolase [Helianthus debilis subsp. tardiflorus]